MWVTPSAIPPSGSCAPHWREMASNSHFVLLSETSRKSLRLVSHGTSVLQSLIAGAASFVTGDTETSKTPATALSSNQSDIEQGPLYFQRKHVDVNEYRYRIVLRCLSRGTHYVVAVSDEMKSIHSNWNWIERNLFTKVAEMTSETPPDNFDLIVMIDEFLQSQFQIDQAVSSNDGKNGSASETKILDILAEQFEIVDETVIESYGSMLLDDSNGFVRGTLCLTQNHICFFSNNLTIKSCVTYSSVTSVSLGPSRKMFGESVFVTTKDQKYCYFVFFKSKELYNSLSHLCNQAMKKLVIGAEQQKTHDEVMQAGLNDSRSSNKRLSQIKTETSNLERYGSSSSFVSVSSDLNQAAPSPRATHEIDAERRNAAFRLQFRLPPDENVLDEQPCNFHHEISKLVFQGKIFLSRQYLCFASSNTWFVLPIGNIASVSKENSSIVFPVKYLIITLIGQRRTFAFSGLRHRSRMLETLKQRLRNIDSVSVPIGSIVGIEEKRSLTINPFGYEDGDQSDGELNLDTKLLKTGLRSLFPLQSESNSAGQDVERELAWSKYLYSNGRDSCMIRSDELVDLVYRGIPDLFRGDVWLILSGSLYGSVPDGYYREILTENKNTVSGVNDEIEKDLKRSLPEHPAYQSALGLDALRRLLTAYAYRNPVIGYAQAMNMISSVFLLYLREEESFRLLCTLCERLLPEHYGKTLIGAVLDQRVFEHLLEEELPDIASKLSQLEVEISLISFPWFVSLFLSTFPFRAALRVLDCFFCDGAIFLFRLGLALLKANEALLLVARDDDQVMSILRRYFKELGSDDDIFRPTSIAAVPEDEDVAPGRGHSHGSFLTDRLFQDARHLFPSITSTYLEQVREKLRLRIVQQMEDSNKKGQIRQLPDSILLISGELELIYDEFKKAQFVGEEVMTRSIRYKVFARVTLRLLPWPFSASSKSFPHSAQQRGRSSSSGAVSVSSSVVVNNECLLQRFYTWIQRQSQNNIVDLTGVVLLYDIMLRQPAEKRAKFLFDVHDVDGDGYLSKDELTCLMESLLEFASSDQPSDSYLKSVSIFMSGALRLGSRQGDIANQFRLSFSEYLVSLLAEPPLAAIFESSFHLVLK